MKTTYIAVHHETGNVCGTEIDNPNEAWLDALADAYGGPFAFKRDERGFMNIVDTADDDKECFMAMSLKDDDAAAQDECIIRALRACDSSNMRGRGVLEVVRNEEGEIVQIDPGTTDEPSDPELIAYWERRI